MKEIKEEWIKDPENKLWSNETEDLPEIREIWEAIKNLQYKDEPDYAFIRAKLKQIFERSQCVHRFGSNTFDYMEDKVARPSLTIQPPPQMQRMNEMNMNMNMNMNMGMNKQFKYMPEPMQSPMWFSPYPEKNYIQYNHHIDFEHLNMNNKNYNNTLNSQYSIGMPTSAMQPLSSPSLPKPQMHEYEQQEHNNINLSLNHILRLPYQIVMPPTEINQSISINNLPSLNDLAIRTGINTGMSTIFTSQRPMSAPSPVPMSTSQLILPISSLYSSGCQKDHIQLPIPMMEDHQKYQNYYKPPPKMPMMQGGMMRDPYMQAQNYCYSPMDQKQDMQEGMRDMNLMPNIPLFKYQP